MGGGINTASIILMLLGTQWYILFNVIAGALAIPGDMRDVASIFRFNLRERWMTVILPGIFPYLITGLVTASGRRVECQHRRRILPPAGPHLLHARPRRADQSRHRYRQPEPVAALHGHHGRHGRHHQPPAVEAALPALRTPLPPRLLTAAKNSFDAFSIEPLRYVLPVCILQPSRPTPCCR